MKICILLNGEIKDYDYINNIVTNEKQNNFLDSMII